MALYRRACVRALTSLLQLQRPTWVKSLFPISEATVRVIGQRTLLTDAYKGTSAWRTRKILATNMDELKITLDADFFDFKKPVASVDLHKFMDNISDEHDLKSAEQYLYCHRHSSVAHHLRASTMHSFIRTCLDLGQADTAVKVLQDKTNYGVFPDNFTFNLLLDDYLERGDIKGAAAVAMEMMTLEVLTDEEPLSRLLALYCCHRYLKSGDSAREVMHDLGMTFADATRGQTSLLSSSYHALGLVMAGRLKQAARFLQAEAERTGDGGPCLVQEVVEGLLAVPEEQPDVEEELRGQLQECVSRLQAEGRISAESLDSLVTTEILPEIQRLQADHTHAEQYPEMLAEWHRQHVEAVRRQIRAAQEYEMSLKKKKLEKLLEATGGLRYWLQKEERRKAAADAEAGKEQSGETTEEQELDKQTV
ncbi:28S ribosomal protein S27, mitochondrial-like isoform X2 [Acanthaster planci]|uniref:28S ribosomal protein S27, mitochondrial-like isoform X2 n=1 Tax=Acanthaster planci TaxID=133434 RepID=A0A8B7ZSQ6_ACAPL|nr:28S ribosomal protein S27, mitochondrial-like isoform X2 [Acanthaster planci]